MATTLNMVLLTERLNCLPRHNVGDGIRVDGCTRAADAEVRHAEPDLGGDDHDHEACEEGEARRADDRAGKDAAEAATEAAAAN